MTTQLDYFEWIESESMETNDRPMVARGRFRGSHSLGQRPMLGDKVLDPDELISLDDCVEFTNDPRHEPGLMFDGRPLRNIEMSAIHQAASAERELIRMANKVRERTSAGYLDNENLIDQVIELGEQLKGNE